jgi:hypothetical protein
MLGFKSTASARTILGDIEMVHMMRQGQAKYAGNPQPSLAEQFDLLAALTCDGALSVSASLLQICDATSWSSGDRQCLTQSWP